MTYLVFAVVVIAGLRCISFGVYTIKKGNISGGIASMVLSVLSLVAGFAVFY